MVAATVHGPALFEARQSEAAELVEARLAQILAQQASEVPGRLADAMQHAALGGGKRFRACLVVEGARLFRAPPAAALDVAAALECVHAYSLVHDDLPAMDNDELRRGRPTVWKAFDEWTAILAGDALLTLAFEILAGVDGAPASIRLALVSSLARGAGRAGMAGGQALDLEADKLGRPPVATLDHIRRLQAMKTGALIRFASEAGAVLGGADAAQQHAMGSYGSHLGLAFQISDDLLDVEGDAALMGKAVGKDQSQGKATLVALMGAGGARAQLALAVESAIGALDGLGPEAEALREAALFMLRRKK